jgi:SP family myo-inositol transporter-like MFS transporter 13
MSFDEKHPGDAQKDDRAVPMQHSGKGELSEIAVVAEGEERTTIFVWLLVLVSSISGLLFGEWFDSSYKLCPYREHSPGYDTGVISGALVTIGSDLGPQSLSSTQAVSLKVHTRNGSY